MAFKIKPEYVDFQPPNCNCKFGDLSQASIKNKTEQWRKKYCVKQEKKIKKKITQIEDL